MIKAQHIIIILLWLLSGSAIAQLTEADTLRYRTQVALQGRYNFGNFERLITTAEGAVLVQTAERQWSVLNQTRYTYGTFGTAVTENDWLVRSYAYWHGGARLYPYLMHWWQRTKLAALGSRHQLGMGGTYVPLKSRNHVLKVSLMGSVETNQYDRPGLSLEAEQNTNQYQTVRGTLRLAGMHQVASMKLGYELYIQPSVLHWADRRLFADAYLQAPLLPHLQLKLAYTYEHNTMHVNSLKPQDGLATAGIVYSWQRQ